MEVAWAEGGDITLLGVNTPPVVPVGCAETRVKVGGQDKGEKF